MKNSPDKSHFEDQWKQAFEGKEISPSPNVWNGIDAHLANQQAGSYRRTAIFYRWVAAASVVILLGWTGYYMVNRNQDADMQVATQESPVTTDNTQSTISEPSSTDLEDVSNQNDLQLAQSDLNSGSDNGSANESQLAESPVNASGTDENIEIPASENENMLAVQDPVTEEESLPTSEEKASNPEVGASVPMIAATEETEDPISTEENTNDGQSLLSGAVLASSDIFESTDSDGLRRNKPLGFDIISTELVSMEPEAIPIWDFELPEDESNEDQVLFAGLNFSPGVFDPNFSNSNVAAESLSDASFDVPVSQSVTESTVDQGFSYGVGMNAGFPVGKKWILQGGLEYQVGRSETSTSLIVESASGSRSALTFTNSFQAEDLSNTVSISAPTDVTSDYRFLSVPLKAGYSILNKKKFGLMLSAGVSSDFFLSNTISSDQSGVSSFRQSSGSGSPFRTVYFSGLSSVTLSYNLSRNYLILLEPSFKAALSDFSKSSEVFNSRPNSFGIGVGVRYRFR